MPTIKLPGNLGTVFTHRSQAEADQTKALLDARHAFAKKYCEEHGWTSELSKLSIEQILEIRAQEGWKNPVV